jgi:hypothetical protein
MMKEAFLGEAFPAEQDRARISTIFWLPGGADSYCLATQSRQAPYQVEPTVQSALRQAQLPTVDGSLALNNHMPGPESMQFWHVAVMWHTAAHYVLYLKLEAGCLAKYRCCCRPSRLLADSAMSGWPPTGRPLLSIRIASTQKDGFDGSWTPRVASCAPADAMYSRLIIHCCSIWANHPAD